MKAPLLTCSTCHQLLASATGTPLCAACLFITLCPEATRVVNHSLYERQFLTGIIKLKASLNIGLTESKELYAWRYHQLRQTTPDLFPYPDTAYWMS